MDILLGMRGLVLRGEVSIAQLAADGGGKGQHGKHHSNGCADARHGVSGGCSGQACVGCDQAESG
eukprot:CAMPEP_0197892314 /NCGR_PEP_ID=MMETSP1439-20131203/30077_1 /TAXON_ID=66791 /ORGANISM="Gonyaulax spinifera, Strain CCMP409" /LENGTH=64 /DNA_ID=CAMNT_0043512473 /DNA_START=405 /DNA_END=596 /DNA_ORIENTATION=-